MKRKNIVILGSTGSIGVNTLKVIERYPRQFKVVGLSAWNNYRLLAAQTKKFSPTHVAVGEKSRALFKKQLTGIKVNIFDVDSEIEELVR